MLKEEPWKQETFHTFHYTFKDEEGEIQSVCKIFYLTTLGYKKTNDWPVLGLFKNTSKKEVIHPQDKRGRASSVNKISDTEILDHIESYNPTISHYRREHAPNVRYLPSDVNISIMHKHFREMYPNITCSYELYRLKVKEKIYHSVSSDMKNAGHVNTSKFITQNIRKQL